MTVDWTVTAWWGAAFAFCVVWWLEVARVVEWAA